MKRHLVLFALVEIFFLSIASLPLGFWDTKLLHTHSSIYLKFPSRFIYIQYIRYAFMCSPSVNLSVDLHPNIIYFIFSGKLKGMVHTKIKILSIT